MIARLLERLFRRLIPDEALSWGTERPWLTLPGHEGYLTAGDSRDRRRNESLYPRLTPWQNTARRPHGRAR